MIVFQPLSMNKRRHQVKPEAQAGMYLMQVNIGLISAEILFDIFYYLLQYCVLNETRKKKEKSLYFLKLDHIVGRQSTPQPLPRLQLHLQPSVQVMTNGNVFAT